MHKMQTGPGEAGAGLNRHILDPAANMQSHLNKISAGSKKHFWICAVAVAALDQVTKFFFFALPAFDTADKIAIVPNWFYIVRRTNPAAAFSIGPENPLFYIVATLLGMAVLIWLLTDLAENRLLPVLGLGLVCGGAVGNLIDRVFVGGEVRDFIEIYYWQGRPWPAFNVADAAICLGVAIVLIETFRSTSGSATQPEKPASEMRKRPTDQN